MRATWNTTHAEARLTYWLGPDGSVFDATDYALFDATDCADLQPRVVTYVVDDGQAGAAEIVDSAGVALKETALTRGERAAIDRCCWALDADLAERHDAELMYRAELALD